MTLRLTAPQYQTLRTHLLQDDRERVVLLGCGTSGPHLVVNTIERIPDDELEASTDTACGITDTYERDLLTRFHVQDLHPIWVHSHPFAEDAWFSAQDWTVMQRYRTWLDPLYPSLQPGFAVLSRDAFRVRSATTDEFPEVPIQILGDWTLETSPQLPSNDTQTDWDTATYDRQVRAFGIDGQAALADTHVAIVGVGGIGCELAQTLAALGIGNLTLIDPDHVERSNLPRLRGIYESDIDRPKAAVVAERCTAENPALSIAAVTRPVQDTTRVLETADVIMAGVDAMHVRAWLNEHAIANLQPYIDAGTRIELDADDRLTQMEAYVQTIGADSTGCMDCLNRLDADTIREEQLSSVDREAEAERGYIDGTDQSPAPAVLPLNQTAVSLATNTLIKLVTGYDTPTGLIRHDALADETMAMQTRPDPHCYTCGTHGVLGLGDHVHAPPNLETVEAVTTFPAPPEPHGRYTIPDSVTAFFTPEH